MQYFKLKSTKRLWENSAYTQNLLSREQLLIIEECISNLEDETEFELLFQDILFRSEKLLINRLVVWLKNLNAARPAASISFNKIILAVLWAFDKRKPITTQTQHQLAIGCSIMQDVLKFNIPLPQNIDAEFLLMNILIISERPDLLKNSILKELKSFRYGHSINIFKSPLDSLTNFLFTDRKIPDFLFKHLIYCSNTEYRIVINLLDGKSLRKILPETIKISKSENAVLQTTAIKISDVDDQILERYVAAARILKLHPSEHQTINQILRESKIFRHQFPTFFNDINYWQTVFNFIVKNETYFRLRRHSVSHFIDYFEHQRYFLDNSLSYNLKGRTLASIERNIDFWIRRLDFNPKYLSYKWESFPIDKWTKLNGSESYYIEEITNGKRLLHESKILQHCVFTYINNCSQGHIHIFSLSVNENNKKNPLYTIEVRGKYIEQVGGKNNIRPDESILSLIKEWAVENGLILRVK